MYQIRPDFVMSVSRFTLKTMSTFKPPVFSYLRMPAAAAVPSTRTIQASEDGQIFVVTRPAIYILTPNLGLRLDDSNAFNGAARQGDRTLDVTWFRTHIELSKTHFNWSNQSPASWATAVLGCLELAWHSAAISPTGLSATAGCVLVTLTTNLELSLWQPDKNYAQGAWNQTQNVTELLLEHYAEVESDLVNRTLEAQTSSMAWSHRPICCSDDMARGRNAEVLLALGSRAGSINFLRYDLLSSRVRHVYAHSVVKDWITQVAWSPWRYKSDDAQHAMLACGLANGCVSLVRVLQRQADSGETQLSCDSIDSELGSPLSQADDTGITALEWIISRSGAPILVHCKPGIVVLSRLPPTVFQEESSHTPDGLQWEGSRTLSLETQRVSSGSSALMPASGVNYEPGHDVLIVTLHDGSMNIIRDVSTCPSLASNAATSRSPSSLVLSEAVRSVFVAHEERSLIRPVTAQDVNRSTGCMTFAVNGHMLWISEACRPNFFDFVSDAHQQSAIVLSQLWDPIRPVDAVVDLVRRILSDPDADARVPPTYSLRSVFLHLSRPDTSIALQTRLLDLFDTVPAPASSPFPSRSPKGGDDIPPPSHLNLQQRLEHDNTLRVLNLQFAIADACTGITGSDEALLLRWNARSKLLELEISRARCTILLEYLDRFGRQLGGPEHMAFVARVFTQVRRLNCSGKPQEIASQLVREIGLTVEDAEHIGADDSCPACAAAVAIDHDGRNARCAHGHVWTRCTITSFVLATAHVRTCAGCNRKALIAPSSLNESGISPSTFALLPQAARSAIVDSLLRASRWCPYCGNRFVVLL